jgi:phage antirepressor YoqD-like protein
MDREALFEWLRQQRYAYRYTGIGKKLAYVRWVRSGFFENEPMEMMITVRGMRMIRRDIQRSPLALNGTTKT